MNTFFLREAGPEDISGILSIYAPFVLSSHTSFEYVVPSAAEMQQRIQSVLQDAPWLVATAESQVIGYAYATPYRSRKAYTWTREVSVYVADNHHRKGVASALYRTLFQLLKLQGYQRVIAGIALPNPESIIFHEKCGFQHAGTMTGVGYKFGQFWDVGFWEMQINTTPPQEICLPESLRQSQSWQDILQGWNGD